MILVDPRPGSRELLPTLKSQAGSIPVELAKSEMPGGDFAFEGNGPEGTCLIGIERKTVRDMISCIQTGRFSGHQLLFLREMYQFSYLIIEGIFRPNPVDGIIEEPRFHEWKALDVRGRRFMYQELVGFLFTIERMEPSIRVHQTPNQTGTASRILSLYRWWNGKDFNKHRAHLAIPAGRVELYPSWPLVRRVAKEMYRIGWENSQAVANHFGSVSRMMAASMEEWSSIRLPCGKGRTRRLGDATADKIFKEVHIHD